MIKQIYFDVGKVIVTRRTPDGHNISRLLEITNEKYDFILNHLIESQSPEQKSQFWNIRTIEDEYKYLEFFHKRMCDFLGKKYDDEFIKKLSECRIKADFIINEGVIETLQILKQKYQLSILSNALPSRRHHELQMNNLISYFDPVIISFEIGLYKPEKKIFEYILSLSEFKPEEIAFVDDNLDNLRMAKECGFAKCILFSKNHSDEFASINEFKSLIDLI